MGTTHTPIIQCNQTIVGWQRTCPAKKYIIGIQFCNPAKHRLIIPHTLHGKYHHHSSNADSFSYTRATRLHCIRLTPVLDCVKSRLETSEVMLVILFTDVPCLLRSSHVECPRHAPYMLNNIVYLYLFEYWVTPIHQFWFEFNRLTVPYVGWDTFTLPEHLVSRSLFELGPCSFCHYLIFLVYYSS